MKLQTTSKHSKIVISNDEHIGTALELANGRWGAFDKDERHRLSELTFATPKDVLAYFKLAGRPALSDDNGGAGK